MHRIHCLYLISSQYWKSGEDGRAIDGPSTDIGFVITTVVTGRAAASHMGTPVVSCTMPSIFTGNLGGEATANMPRHLG